MSSSGAHYVSQSYVDYLESSIRFATCGIVIAGGTNAYLKGEFTKEPQEKREKDGQDAYAVLRMLLFSHVIDNFQSYLSDLLLEVLREGPKALYGRKIDAKLIFEVPDLASLKKRAIEKFVLDLGYKNVTELSEFLSDTFGLKSLNGRLTGYRLNRLIQIRNVITHNRGTVNEIYLFRSKSKIDTLGEQVKVFHPIHTANYLEGLADKLNREAVSKFALPPAGSKNA